MPFTKNQIVWLNDFVNGKKKETKPKSIKDIEKNEDKRTILKIVTKEGRFGKKDIMKTISCTTATYSKIITETIRPF